MTGHHDSPAGDAEDLEGLAGFYRLLSRLWVSELDAEWLETLVDGSLADVAEELEFPLDGPREEVLEQLAIEYCGLVIGPKNHVPPHESLAIAETGTEKGGDVTELTELARVFFATHVMWITRFLARAGAATDSKFYLRLIAVTSEFLAEEHEVWGVD